MIFDSVTNAILKGERPSVEGLLDLKALEPTFNFQRFCPEIDLDQVKVTNICMIN